MWKEVKRIKSDDLFGEDDDNDATHICLVKLAPPPDKPDAPPQYCNDLLKLHKTKVKEGSGQTPTWLTTRAVEHLCNCHPVDSPNGAKFAKAKREWEGDIAFQQMAYGMPTAEGEMVGAETGSMFLLTKKEKSLSSQAEWYVYSSMQISKSEFESYWFKNMLQEVGDGARTCILTPEMLRNFVRGEFEVFLLFLKVIINVKFAEAMGHAFAQGLHDGGTLVSKRKYQVLALQFIAPEFKKNLLVTIGLLRSKHNKDKDVATLWKDTTLTRTGHEFSAIVGRMRADKAAKGVAGACGMDEEEVCEMHNTDKLGRVATGALVRTKNRFVINREVPARGGRD